MARTMYIMPISSEQGCASGARKGTNPIGLAGQHMKAIVVFQWSSNLGCKYNNLYGRPTLHDTFNMLNWPWALQRGVSSVLPSLSANTLSRLRGACLSPEVR